MCILISEVGIGVYQGYGYFHRGNIISKALRVIPAAALKTGRTTMADFNTARTGGRFHVRETKVTCGLAWGTQRGGGEVKRERGRGAQKRTQRKTNERCLPETIEASVVYRGCWPFMLPSTSPPPTTRRYSPLLRFK